MTKNFFESFAGEEAVAKESTQPVEWYTQQYVCYEIQVLYDDYKIQENPVLLQKHFYIYMAKINMELILNRDGAAIIVSKNRAYFAF